MRVVLSKPLARIFALLLLLSAASCLLASDPFFPQSCQEDSASGPSDAGCFCCCGHVMPRVPLAPSIVYTVVATVSDPPLIAFSADRPLIYHPPRV